MACHYADWLVCAHVPSSWRSNASSTREEYLDWLMMNDRVLIVDGEPRLTGPSSQRLACFASQGLQQQLCRPTHK